MIVLLPNVVTNFFVHELFMTVGIRHFKMNQHHYVCTDATLGRKVRIYDANGFTAVFLQEVLGSTIATELRQPIFLLYE